MTYHYVSPAHGNPTERRLSAAGWTRRANGSWHHPSGATVRRDGSGWLATALGVDFRADTLGSAADVALAAVTQ